MATIEEINQKIEELKAQKKALQDLNKAKIEINKDWLKDVVVEFKFNNNSEYKYFLEIKEGDPKTEDRVVMGTDANPVLNVTYKMDILSGNQGFLTGSKDLLIKFLKQANFKDVLFDQELLEIFLYLKK